ncbi:DUF2785 domain-containing protein [Nocardioides sp. AX2bis]|uniref:DUF2785 domain-containing protein n=1 Tax=Nocardioides sp. AX2bis TaxID=2653157 RepID=UPI0012F1BE7E|nr:DUF2785 domain-containing protein [Nocardioides sp. AX2bis]VXB19275.1 conserved hypothetical protein [Nocardioides sp. AX2bis]
MTPAQLTQIVDADFAVPADRPLADVTADLIRALGDPDPVLRDDLALPVLATWIERGVYDDLLVGLGDGLATGLLPGIGEQGTGSVFRRSFSALALAECLQRDTGVLRVPSGKVLEWGDRLATWFLAEQDTRGQVPGHGWAHAVAHGADALGVLAGSPHLGREELEVVLEVLADRLVRPSTTPEDLLVAGEPDRLASAVLAVLRRDLVPLDHLEGWVARLTDAADAAVTGTGDGTDGTVVEDPYLAAGNLQAFLRALHLQLVLAPDPPEVRSDLLLLLVDALRRTNPYTLAVPAATTAV